VPPALVLKLFTADEVEDAITKLRGGDTEIIYQEQQGSEGEDRGSSSPVRKRARTSPPSHKDPKQVSSPGRVIPRKDLGVQVTLERDSLACLLGFRSTADRLKCEQFLATADLCMRPVSRFNFSNFNIWKGRVDENVCKVDGNALRVDENVFRSTGAFAAF
jgi:hypothetical protein